MQESAQFELDFGDDHSDAWCSAFIFLSSRLGLKVDVLLMA